MGVDKFTTNETYDLAKQIIIEKRSQLINDGELLEDDCVMLREAIESLPDLEMTSNKVDKTVYNKDFEYYVSAFGNTSSELQSILKEIIQQITEGYCPSRSFQKCNDLFVELQVNYDAICDVAKSELQKEELPRKGSPVSKYVESYKNCQKALNKKQLLEAKTVFESFIHLKTDSANLAIALKPFQIEAENTVKKIEQGTVKNVSEIDDKLYNGVSLFMKSIYIDDLNSDEGITILDSLEDDYGFPRRVTRGLSSKGYYLKNVEELPEVVSVDTVEEKSEYIDGFMKELMDSEVSIEEDKFGLLSSNISLNENKKITVSIFLNEIKKGKLSVIKNIIRISVKYPLVFPELVGKICNISVEDAEKCMIYMHAKGYLRKYRLIPGGWSYCITKRLVKALTFKGVSNFLGMKQLSHDEYSDVIDDKASSFVARKVFINVISDRIDHYGENKAKLRMDEIFMTESFISTLTDNSEIESSEIIIGIFWTGYDECKLFHESFNRILNDTKRINRFVVAAYNRDIAKSVIKVIKKMALFSMNEVKIVTYSYAELEYYDEDEI